MRRLGPNLLVLSLFAGLPGFGFATLPASAQLATVVQDLSQDGPIEEGYTPRGFAQIGRLTLFVGWTPQTGWEPWVTDGTVPGTRLLADTCPGTCDSDLSFRGTDGDRAFFVAAPPEGEGYTYRGRLWVTDGTPSGTVRLKDSRPGPGVGPSGTEASFGVTSHLLHGQLLFFTEVAPPLGNELWASDGTVAGTRQIYNFNDGGYGVPGWMAHLGDRLTFFFYSAIDLVSLWATDGTADGTSRIAELGDGPAGINGHTVVPARGGKRLVFLFRHRDGRLHMGFSDGSRAGTAFLPLPENLRLGSSERAFFALHGDHAYFVLGTDDFRQIWKTDGTPDGTGPVLQLSPETATTPEIQPEQIAGVPGKRGALLLLRKSSGWDLRVFDLPGGGSRLLPGPCADGWRGCPPRGMLLAVNGSVLLPYDRGAASGFLRMTGYGPSDAESFQLCEGESASCRLSESGRISLPAVRLLEDDPSRAYFFAENGSSVLQLWTTDGTPEGTSPRTDFAEEPTWPSRHLDVVHAGSSQSGGGRDLYFGTGGVTSPGSPTGLWATRDAPGSTLRLAEFPVRAPGSILFDVAALGDRRLLLTSARHGHRLWTIQGDPPTIRLLAEGNFLGSCSSGHRIQNVGNSYAVFTEEAPGYCRLWRTDGTPEGTRAVGGVTPDPSSGVRQRYPAVLGGLVYFITEGLEGAREAENGIWRTDGTPQGTALAVSAAALGVGRISGFSSDGERLYFVEGAEAPSQGVGLWTSDGTEAGTRLLAESTEWWWEDLSLQLQPTRFGDDLLVTSRAFHGPESVLWRIDEAALEPERLADLFAQSDFSSGFPRLVRHNDSLYFYGLLAPHSEPGLYRLLKPGNTIELVKRFSSPRLYSESYVPSDPVVYQHKLYLLANDGETGRELWRSDGTPEGTELVLDIRPGDFGPQSNHLVSTHSGLFFRARHPTLGMELWRSDGTAAGTQLVHDIYPGPAGSDPSPFEAAGGRLYFSADDGFRGREVWSLDLADPSGVCVPSDRELCLRGTDYRATLGWFDRDGNSAQALTRPLTSDTGAFYYRNPDNLETVVKVLDGRPINDHLWTFLASLSNVEYVLDVTHAESGISRRYRNPQGNFASFGDTFAFGPEGTPLDLSTALAAGDKPTYEVNLGEVAPGDGVPWRLAQSYSERRIAPRTCAPSPERLCLQDGRFAVEVDWRDFRDRTGAGTAVPLTPDTGYFWFFDDANVELILKVLDGTELNGNFWVFYGALSNVEYQLTVTDTEQGVERTYFNPLRSFASVGDTGAFPQ